MPLLRIKGVDVDRRVIVVRDGKCGKDRVVMLPSSQLPDLRRQASHARAFWEQDRALNRPGVEMPNALVRKCPNGGISWRTAAGTVASPLDSLAAHA
jgi:hypothetical protein